MCGRFVLTASPELLQQSFNLTSAPSEVVPRYNIAPTQAVAVITNEPPRSLSYLKWGLIPSWSKDMTMAAKMINARSETAAEKPSFRTSFRRRRCIIPTDGFYEWRAEDKNKIPMFIQLQDRPLFGMAGLWDIWQSADGSEVRTCSILTTSANEFMRQFHERMPVILSPQDYDVWLSPREEPLPILQGLMQPYPADAFSAYEVSKAVNRPVNDSPELIRPVA